MSEERVIKYLRHPAYSAAQLTTRNPYLFPGEIVFEVDGSNEVKNCKIGPGLWNDLDYFRDDIYLINTPVTNPIGDASGDISSKSTREILELMLHPYQIPAFTSIINNAGGGASNVNILEIGQTLSGNVTVTYVLSNSQNLLGITPINITAGGIFSGEGAKVHSGSIVMSLIAPLAPTGITTYTISLTATHTNGTTSSATTSFKFYPKIIWGTTAVLNPNASDINALTQKQTLKTNDFTRDYTFNSTGYLVVAVPAMLGLTTAIFTDVTDPNAPAGLSMENLGNISINNGVGTYLYTILRSTFFITAPISILRIS